MYDLIFKPVAVTFVVIALLFLFHVFGPVMADTVCPYLEVTSPERALRCAGFFDILS